MSGKEFFIKRYKELGWKFTEIQLRQAIRINRSRIAERPVLERLLKRGIIVEKIPFLRDGYWIKRAKVSPGATSEYLLGYYSIQEAASQIPVTLFTNLKDKIVLDACAAPGGKTVQLADLMCNSGLVLALDISQQRLNALANHLERCNTKNTVVYNMDARNVQSIHLSFDRILLDVPCSGNFAGDKYWFRNRSIKDVEVNAKTQREILTKAVKVLKDDGQIVYSTCSLEPEENELNINWALANLNVEIEETDAIGENGKTKLFGKRLDESIRNCRRIWPEETQGFFFCKLRKKCR